MSFFRKDISNASDEELVQWLGSKRSNEALTLLHARYSKKVLGFFIRMFQGDIDKAQDFTQDVFIRILEKHHLFDSSKQFQPWLFSIASNMGKTSFRKSPDLSLSDSEHELKTSVDWTESSLDKEVFHAALKQAIDQLEVHHRLTFVLRYMQDLGLAEIAEITEVSEGTVKSRLFYASKKVALKLEEFNPRSEGMLFKIQ